MDKLHDQIEEIREYGIGHGLSDEQIDSCILDALRQLAGSSTSAADKRRRRSSCARSVGRVLCLSVASLAAIIGLFVLAVWMVPEWQVSTRNWLEPWFYPITKNWRLMTLGLTKSFDLSPFYNSPCLVGNPFAAVQMADCEECGKVRREHTLISVSTRQYENIYMGRSQPLVLQANHPAVSFDELRSWYEENGVTFDAANRKLQRAPPGLNTIDDFLANYTADRVIGDPEFQVEWTSEAVNPSRLIRKLFPRPAFVPRTQEVGLQKTILVTSPEAGPFEPRSDKRGSPAQWYVQASGSREIVLIPPRDCDKCKSIKFVLNQGDILCYNALVWRLQSLPVKGQREINVAFIGLIVLMM